MRKTRKALAVALVLSAAIGAFGMKAAASDKKSSIYPATMVVTAVDVKNDLVTCSTASGIYYQFFGVDEYETGDIVGMIMDDNGTPDNILDDSIVASRYTGATKFFDELAK